MAAAAESKRPGPEHREEAPTTPSAKSEDGDAATAAVVGEPTWTEEEEAAVRRKLDWQIVPTVTILYLLCFLDRINIGNARIQGMQQDLDLAGYRFNVATSVFYVAYIVVEVPSNAALKRLGPRYYLPGLVCGFGAVSLATGFARTYGQLCGLRALLGLFEGGAMPGIAFFLSSFYRRRELYLRVGTYVSAASMAGAFGGLLAAGLTQIPPWGAPGGAVVHTWRNIFFFEGLITIAAGLLAPLVLPQSPGTSSRLTERERWIAEERLRREARTAGSSDNNNNNNGNNHNTDDDDEDDEDTPSPPRPPPPPYGNTTRIEAEAAAAAATAPGPDDDDDGEGRVRPRHVRRAVLNVNNAVAAAGFFFVNITVQGLSVFMPTLLEQMGWRALEAQYRTVPVYVSASLVAVLVSWASDRTARRGAWLAGFSLLGIAGFALLRWAPGGGGTDNHPGAGGGVRYAAVYLCALGAFPGGPGFLSWGLNNAAGPAVRAVSGAWIVSVGTAGGILAVWAYLPQDGPGFPVGHSINLAAQVVVLFLALAGIAYCARENRLRARGARAGRLAAATPRQVARLGHRHPDFRYMT